MTRRAVTHFSLHRVAGTELRVVADVEDGVLRLIEVEEAVVREYAVRGVWPHRWVTLFVLQDLRPLLRQLPSGSGTHMGPATLAGHPVVNLYDLADPSGCHVFVNQGVAIEQGLWGDEMAMRGLLAHEHAHPLSETGTVRASRALKLELSLDLAAADKCLGWDSARLDSVRRLSARQAARLCVYAPREVLANELAIRHGFSEALLHLNRRYVANARHGVGGRTQLRSLLDQETTEGRLGVAGADLLMLIGDLDGHLDLALETASFYRAGHESEADELEMIVRMEVLPHLEPEVAQAFSALQQQYVALGPNMTTAELVGWGEGVLGILARAAADRNLRLRYHLRLDDESHR